MDDVGLSCANVVGMEFLGATRDAGTKQNSWISACLPCVLPGSIGSLFLLGLMALSILLGGAGCTQNSVSVPKQASTDKPCYGPNGLPAVRDASGQCVFSVTNTGGNPQIIPVPSPGAGGGGGGTTGGGTVGGGTTGGGTVGGGTGGSTGGSSGGGTVITPTPTPTPRCPSLGCQLEGAEIVCNLPPGGTLDVVSSASYPPGFPQGLPAMGLGAPNLGYIPVDWPFTCEAQGLDLAVGSGNSGAGGKICEVNFDHTLQWVAQGRAAYRLRADASLQPGPQLYQFGFTCNTGCTPLHPGFKVRIVCQD